MSYKILVIDDDETILRLIKNILQRIIGNVSIFYIISISNVTGIKSICPND